MTRLPGWDDAPRERALPAESRHEHGTATGDDHRYLGVDTTDLDVAGTVELIKSGVPEIYG